MKLDALLNASFVLSKEKTIEYLTQRINYNLDADKLKALDLLEYIGVASLTV